MKYQRPLAAVALSLTLILSACSSADNAQTAPVPTTTPSQTSSVDADAPKSDPSPEITTPDAILADFGMSGMDATQIIDKLDHTAIPDRPEGLMASIRTNELILAADGKQASLPIPDDKFYVSFAPYVTKTHDCFYHSLTTCTGEMQNTDIQVKITDKDGKAFLDKQVKTQGNGFYGVWLPRGFEGTLHIEAQGKQVTVPLGTGEKDPTCITTTQLA